MNSKRLILWHRNAVRSTLAELNKPRPWQRTDPEDVHLLQTVHDALTAYLEQATDGTPEQTDSANAI